VSSSVSEPTLDCQWFAFPEDPETTDGHVATFAASGDEVVIFDADGHHLTSWSTGLTEGHCISVSHDDAGDHIWIADPGTKMVTDEPGRYHAFTPGDHGRVVKFDLTGRLILELGVPDHPAYDGGRFAPTAVVADSAGDGGTGNIWVGDGYGASLVHVFGPDGDYLQTLPVAGRDQSSTSPIGRISDCRSSDWTDDSIG
jgi:hypothetical protein